MIIEKLKKRYGVKYGWQLLVILLVFALTGTTLTFLSRYIGLTEDKSLGWRILEFIFIDLPIYNLLLLIYGFIFGQFRFFYQFEKRFFNRFAQWFKSLAQFITSVFKLL